MVKASRVRWNEGEKVEANARRLLPELVAGYYAGGRKLLAGSPAPKEMHALRLQTKRLRYTLELFRPCYGPGLETRLAELQQLQKLLGEINDCVAAGRLLAKELKGVAGKRMEDFLDGRAAAKTQEFRKLWAQDFDALGKERKWTDYLSRSARRPARRG
jgi:CHAD domain-containing protein